MTLAVCASGHTTVGSHTQWIIRKSTAGDLDHPTRLGTSTYPVVALLSKLCVVAFGKYLTLGITTLTFDDHKSGNF